MAKEDTEDTGTWETLSFGTDTGLWLKESEEQTLAFANLDGVLYSLTPEGIFCHGGEADGAEGKPIPWSATFAPFTETVHSKKGYSRLLLRLELEELIKITASIISPTEDIIVGVGCGMPRQKAEDTHSILCLFNSC